MLISLPPIINLTCGSATEVVPCCPFPCTKTSKPEFSAYLGEFRRCISSLAIGYWSSIRHPASCVANQPVPPHPGIAGVFSFKDSELGPALLRLSDEAPSTVQQLRDELCNSDGEAKLGCELPFFGNWHIHAYPIFWKGTINEHHF